jgi:hypothetical protein
MKEEKKGNEKKSEKKMDYGEHLTYSTPSNPPSA